MYRVEGIFATDSQADIRVGSERGFEEFKLNNKSYLSDLKNRMTVIYKAYSFINDKRFQKLSRDKNCYDLARKIGFGMLMRHALEAMSACIASEGGIDVGGKSVHERLTALKGQFIPNYDRRKEEILFRALDITNEIAHPHIISDNEITFDQMKEFYDDSLKDLIKDHIYHVQNLNRNAFAVFNAANRFRKHTNKYLIKLKTLLDNFNVRNEITSALIKGCLVRHLTECSVNLWCFNNKIIPTDASTFENQISLGGNLSELSAIANMNRETGFGSSALTPDVVSRLYDLKNTSNSIMHVDTFSVKKIFEVNKRIMHMYFTIESECSPDVMEKKLAESAGVKLQINFKPATITTLLCGFAGWFGIHHFYCGNIGTGIVFLLLNILSACKRLGLLAAFMLQGGWLIKFLVSAICFVAAILPIISLFGIRSGDFVSAKWGTHPKTRRTTVLATIFIIIHILLVFI